LIDRLFARGRKWCEFISTSHVAYEGNDTLLSHPSSS
jgi:hypothetical protein